MKKFLTLISIALAVCSAYGLPTKEEFDALRRLARECPCTVKGKAKAVEIGGDVIKPILAWALQDPKAFYNSNERANAYLLVAYCESKKLDIPEGVADFAICDGRRACNNALDDESAFEELKAAKFEYEGMKMKAFNILKLCEEYSDIKTAEDYVSEKDLAGDFDKYLNILENGLGELSAKEAFDKYAQVIKRFEPYKEKVKKVNENWTRLLSNSESMGKMLKSKDKIDAK